MFLENVAIERDGHLVFEGDGAVWVLDTLHIESLKRCLESAGSDEVEIDPELVKVSRRFAKWWSENRHLLDFVPFCAGDLSQVEKQKIESLEMLRQHWEGRRERFLLCSEKFVERFGEDDFEIVEEEV